MRIMTCATANAVRHGSGACGASHEGAEPGGSKE